MVEMTRHTSRMRLAIGVCWTLGLLLALKATTSLAADPVRGETLYLTSPANGLTACTGCHTITPFANNTDLITRGRNSPTTINNTIANNLQMQYFSSYYNASDIEDIAAYLGNTPETLDFGSVNVGSVSASQTVTVYASTLVALDLTSISVSGDYARAGGTCPTGASTLAAGTTCTVDVTFTPSTTGTRTGTLSVAHSDTTTPVSIALTGSGTASASPAIAIQPTSLAFSSQPLGTTSSAQAVTVTNSGNAPLSMSGFAISGSASSDFEVTAASTCSTATALAAGANCTLEIAFTPAMLGGRTATLTISSNASNGSVSAGLSGNGVTAPTPAVSLSSTSVNFGTVAVGNSAPTSDVVLTNSGTATLNITSITLSTDPPFSLTHDCPASLAAGSSCTLTLGFMPTTATTASGSVSIVSDAASSPDTIALAGAGTTQSLPALAWSGGATSLAFGDVAVGSSSTPQSLTLTNQGPGSVTLQSLTVSGSQASEFLIDASSTCAAGESLAEGATCTIVLLFRPADVGTRSASLGVTSSGINPSAVALSGTGVSNALPVLTPSSDSLTFYGPAAPAQTLSVADSGGATLSIASIAVVSGPFTVQPAATDGCPPGGFDLSPGQTCSVVVNVAAGTNSKASGDLRIASNASGSPTDIPISYSIPVMTNIGGGGCAMTKNADGSIDPTLWLLALLAAGALAWRARFSGGASRQSVSGIPGG